MSNMNQLTDGLLSHLGKKCDGPFPDFLGLEVFLVGCEHPLVAERVGQLPAAITPEHIRYGHRDRAAGCRGAVKGLIHVLDVEVKRDRRASQRLRAAAPLLWGF